jgi:putative SOS response-associated peptidase YedK
MCGIFTQMASWEGVVTFSEALTSSDGPARTVRPMDFADVVCLDETGARVTRKMRWGGAKKGSTAPGNRPENIHAQAEKLDGYWLYLAQQRGILITRTFNEGKEVSKSKTDQYTFTPKDAQPLGIAVIYEKWEREDGSELYTFIMMTTPANRQIIDNEITDRMPAVLTPDKWAVWLGETNASVEEAKALLVPVDGDWTMEAAPKNKKTSKPAPQKPPAPQDPQFDLF